LGSCAVELNKLAPSDNQGGVAWVHSEAITKRPRHVNLGEVAIRDAIRFGGIEVGHIPNKLNPADLLTKELKGRQHFFQLRATLMSPRTLSPTPPDAMTTPSLAPDLGSRGVLETDPD
jgi:hypothetical protein